MLIAFRIDTPPTDTETLIVKYPPPFELAFGKPRGRPIDIWYLGLMVSDLASLFSETIFNI